MIKQDWLETTVKNQDDTVIGRATRTKEWAVWVNMKDAEGDNGVYVTGLDKDGNDINTEQFVIYPQEIVLVFVKGFHVALAAKKDDTTITCKYRIVG